MIDQQRLTRLYDGLIERRNEAASEYIAADHFAQEEYHRGYRDALDEALGLLDGLVEEASK